MYFYDLLKENRLKLNANEEEILAFLLAHSNIKQLGIRSVAAQFYTAPNTITRMVKKLGFSGYSEFKDALFISQNEHQSFADFTSLDQQIVKTKQLLNPEIVQEIIRLIHQADKILILGVGLSRLPSEELDSYLKLIGKQTLTFIEPHLMLHAAKKLTPTDLCIAFSISGETENIIKPLNVVKTNGGRTVSITGFSTNRLSKISDYQLYGLTSKLIIDGLDSADRLSFHYLVNTLFTEYIKRYYPDIFA
ncbi:MULTISPECIES: MurR/RpiR family transcriptional regulator [unclassified Enterococcus]|uniref:MurR/RpiR family transcriptional regulator n=1 Tax=unclassified Enterococcus TaxID=2608891 RepID=UPI00155313DF|nr:MULTISPECIES: MurR/RpiR family transcriptional regulator [unclassified Enterococcus]MBS7578234.1 MurR/RpiR family transcriptional regulator [Enterococcus sp. MMGLQ5-2]MBS7585527.1 MurR/RpiR family transcriptional regulator [Enterococcus sp. MMGLQ5-1]NPD13386.1 MurR/RpiR family transcriptional regulator [Enterococcus sp. MMGLQ5-1]NPD38065.1 MurR/RpiR family transcriptional regulator [Enterococcus sp. MMGLQ5-2]